MKKQFMGENHPTAGICIHKSKLKIYNVDNQPTFFLKDGQEFQMEFFNPTNKVILAKILLNNKSIAQGGLILKPGQRFFLERYFDVAKKFRFETYEVDNTQEVVNAIRNNGDFEVLFYYESDPKPIYNSINISSSYITTTSPLVGNTTEYTTTYGPSNTLNIYNTSLNNSNLSFMEQEYSRNIAKTVETGRVEHGGESTQQLKLVSMNFESTPFHMVKYKLLPVTQQPITDSNFIVKQYCTKCGLKLKNNFKFCPKCGNKI